MKQALTVLTILGLICGYSLWAENNVEDKVANIKPITTYGYPSKIIF